MTKKSEARLIGICDVIACGASGAKACRAFGVSKRSLVVWKNDETLMVDYRGKRMSFRAAMNLAALVPLRDGFADPRGKKPLIPVEKFLTADSTDRVRPPKAHVTRPAALYRHFDAAGALLYVGIALDPVSRLSAHRRKSKWADEITTVTVEYFPTWREAERAERAAIAAERPLHNVEHADREWVRYSRLGITHLY